MFTIPPVVRSIKSGSAASSGGNIPPLAMLNDLGSIMGRCLDLASTSWTSAAPSTGRVLAQHKPSRRAANPPKIPATSNVTTSPNATYGQAPVDTVTVVVGAADTQRWTKLDR